MKTVINDRLIKNENLFRACVCVPSAILFILLSINSVATSGIIIFQIIFTLMAAYFSLSALSYAAYYTNERYEGKTVSLIANKNLSKVIKFLPIAFLFTFIAHHSITTSAHIIFQTILVIMAFSLVLSTIGYAAFYTNDCYGDSAKD
ncbi:hypothetical protein [Thalassotalea piscium]|uniref:DUF2975 domain-containing protein n=1 Tax=Thalassotalea piscium TaxID=1230533 RepID=A0A7X0TUD6_9GAMM|nr:hypothetical protein [Thalassotalea piscium]MBB6543975.1 hypothetical protein [Thalassotalea piscium]